MSELIEDKTAFIEWFQEKYKVALWFEGNELCIPPRSGRSVPVIAHVAWAAWIKRAVLSLDAI